MLKSREFYDSLHLRCEALIADGAEKPVFPRMRTKILIDPYGNEYKIANMRWFCRQFHEAFDRDAEEVLRGFLDIESELKAGITQTPYMGWSIKDLHGPTDIPHTHHTYVTPDRKQVDDRGVPLITAHKYARIHNVTLGTVLRYIRAGRIKVIGRNPAMIAEDTPFPPPKDIVGSADDRFATQYDSRGVRLLSVREYAALWGVNTDIVYRRISKGKIIPIYRGCAMIPEDCLLPSAPPDAKKDDARLPGK